MEAHIHEWLNLLIRWIHFIVGIAWIGASFYFNWLENNLDRKPPQDEGIAGNLWAVHGGGFYHLKKFRTGPERLPKVLHWFKWEAYTTWLSGMSLLVVVYYVNGRLYLVDSSVSDISVPLAIGIGLGSLLGSWIVYDLICKSPLRKHSGLMSFTVFMYFVVLAWGLCELLSGRAAYIHVGAAIGTIMVANVFFVIIPAQREMVTALEENRAPDPAYGESGLLRSRHNNYFTLPVLFIMISSHFPSTYGHSMNWLVLALLALISIVVRHYFNIRHLKPTLIWILPVAFVAMVGVMLWTAPATIQSTQSVSDEQVKSIVAARCVSCHAEKPTQAGFILPPLAIVLESLEQIKAHKDRVYQTTVVTKMMPLGNLTGITDEERAVINAWYQESNQP